MKRIYAIVVFTILTTIAYAQADDKGSQEGAWVLKGVTGLNCRRRPCPTGRREVRILLPEMLI